jgi:hypothetical protein
VPFQKTWEVLGKFVPVRVTEMLDCPATPLLGDTDVKVGAGLMVKGRAADTTDVTVSWTVTFTVPAVPSKVAAFTVAVIELPEPATTTFEIPVAEPSQRTVEVEGKFDPVRVRLTLSGCPATAEVGAMLDNVSALIVKGLLDVTVAPPESCTTIPAEPAAIISPAGTVATIDVRVGVPTMVKDCALPPVGVQFTVGTAGKVPANVTLMEGCPASAVLGVTLVSVGGATNTVNVDPTW